MMGAHAPNVRGCTRRANADAVARRRVAASAGYCTVTVPDMLPP